MADLDSTKIYGDLDVRGIVRSNGHIELTGTTGTSEIKVSETGQTIQLEAASGHVLGVNSAEGPFYQPASSTVHNIWHEGNLTRSDAVNSSSSTSVATSKAVKTAYDKAVIGENAAHTMLPKAGGTMTGVLKLNDNIGVHFGSDADVQLSCTGTQLNMNLQSTVNNFYIKDGQNIRFNFDKATGMITCAGDVAAFSDKRVKKDIKTLTNALNKVIKLRGVSYVRTDTGEERTNIGLIAQEVDDILPEVVYTVEHPDIKDFKSISYGSIVGILIEAIKELDKENQLVKQRLVKLEANRSHA